MSSILTVNPNGKLLIPLQNFWQNSTIPEAGMELGTVEKFEASELKQSTGAQVKMLQQSDEKLALAQSTRSTANPALSDRQAILKAELKLDQQTLDVDAKELEQLENLLLNSDDVFAVDDSELGRTSLIGSAYH